MEGITFKRDEAWQELYRYYYAPLCSYSGKLINDADAAEDIVQGCFVRLWDQPLCFTDLKALTAYMYRSVYNSSLNFVRDKQTSRQIHQRWVDEHIEDEAAAVRLALTEEAITRFYAILSELPAQQREILLCSMKGDRVKDIAEKLSISENTVKTQKKRGYHTIKQKMGEQWLIIFPLLFGGV